MAEWQGRSGVALCHPSLTSAGKAILTKAIRRAGWSTDQFTSCQPHDIPAGTRAIVALGDQAQEALTGWFGGKRSVKYTRGYLLQGFSGLPVVPTFDPTQLAQGQMKLLGLLMNDIGVALQAAVGARKVCLDPKTVTNYRVGLDALRELYAEAVADPNLLVAFDLETATSWGEDEDESIEFSRDAEDEVQDDVEGGNGDDHESIRPGQGGSLSRDALSIERAGIRTVQFSLHPGTGVSCDWSDECRDWVQRIMSLPNPLAGHNQALFDTPILERHGIVFNGGGPIHDTLWMAHHLQPDLPVHLQGVASWINFPFPWKHMSGADLDFYGSVDVDSVQWVMRDLPPKLKRLGLWEGYEKYIRQFRPVLAAMEKRGIPVSKSKLEELRTWLGQEIARMDSELQPMIPAELKGRKYWKSWPADCKPIVAEYKSLLSQEIETDLLGQGKRVTKKALNPVIKIQHFVDPVLGWKWKDRIAELGYGWEGDLLYKTLDFNPRSSDQILQFIRAKGYPVPKRFKDQKDTTSDKELERLEVKTKDPVLTLVRSIRAYSKMGNAYAGKLLEDGTVEGGWQPGPDGRLRATITFGPATGQLSARNPNVMTTPKRRAELANKFRQCIVAESGYKLVELDYTAFHARTLGLAAQDAAYMKLAAMDIHSFVAGHMIKYPGIETALTLSDSDLKQLLEEIKSKHKNVRNFKAKPAILGIGFKMGKRRLYYENRDSYENEAEAGKLISLLHELFPNVFKWQDAICEKADKDGRLINSWGACRWFWDVMKWTRRDGQWVKSTGRDAEKATAYLPSSNAHFMLRDKLLQANSQGWLERYGLINVIHDAVLFHCPTNLVDECVHNIKTLMEASVQQMADPKVAPAGFTCGAEAMVGSDWSNMEEIH